MDLWFALYVQLLALGMVFLAGAQSVKPAAHASTTAWMYTDVD